MERKRRDGPQGLKEERKTEAESDFGNRLSVDLGAWVNALHTPQCRQSSSYSAWPYNSPISPQTHWSLKEEGMK